MAVYVDEARIPWRGREWSHLIADTTEELHAFAARLGIQRGRFQHKPARPWQDHYDVTEATRRRAISLGAHPIDSRQAALTMRSKRLALAAAAQAEKGGRRQAGVDGAEPMPQPPA